MFDNQPGDKAPVATMTKTKTNSKIIAGVAITAVLIGASFVGASLLPAALGTGSGCEVLYAGHEDPQSPAPDPLHKGSVTLGDNSKGNATVYVDQCYSAGTTKVTEYDCQPDGTYIKIVACPSNTTCDQGACISNTATCSPDDVARECLDANDLTKTPNANYETVVSTNSIAFKKQGYCEYVGVADGWDITQKTSIQYKDISKPELGYKTLTDMCSAGKVYEYDCDNSGFVRARLASCPTGQGCVDGACAIVCTDSDVTSLVPDGRNHNVQGTTTGNDFTGSYVEKTDVCGISGTSEGSVIEYYCEENTVKEVAIYCSTGCIEGEGRCDNAPAINWNCDDSLDGGQEYDSKGKTTGKDTSGNYIEKEDFCVPSGTSVGALVEYYCENNVVSYSSPYNCPNSCQDGSCLLCEGLLMDGQWPYSYSGDSCSDHRCITDTTVSPTCYSDFSACDDVCNGSCININVAKEQCGFFGSLNVSISPSTTPQYVPVGTQDFTFTTFTFDATEVTRNVDVTSVALKLSTQGQAYTDLISDIRLYDNGVEILPNNYPGDWEYRVSGTTPGDVATTTYTFDIGAFRIPAGTSRAITVKADIGSGPTIAGDDDTLAIGLQTGSVEAQDDTSNPISVRVNGGGEPVHTLQSGGEVWLYGKVDPSSSLVVGGTTVNVGKFRMRAQGDDIRILALAFKYYNPTGGGLYGDEDEVVSLALYQDGIAEVLGVNYVESRNTTITPSNLILLDGEEIDFTLKATFANVSEATSAQSGAGLKFAVSNFDVTGLATGIRPSRYSIDPQFNSFFLFKSIPTLIPVTNNESVHCGPMDIYKFDMAADSAGDVGVSVFTFGIRTYGLDLSVFDFDEFELRANNTTIARAEDMIISQSGEDYYIVSFLDPDDNTVGKAYGTYRINAGSRVPFTLMAVTAPECGIIPGGGNQAIATSMGGSSRLDLNDDPRWLSHYKFVWTDMSHQNKYASGYLVPGLGSGATTTPQAITD